ncbi:MOSC domain-containing protein [Oscillatoria sp. CS-180]|uniref:MOSC domain-containing protein n=1 Tax=Oscillatoria sp. CS-180 TaxID=3021720 RepID=UPI00233112B4|nr:MOSC domain-containing protein [Oscillatoria sp. CS-180]MDB9526226.1 MOSC domain-containing protein [Oscillatoria sp. CS-180]
MAGHIVQISLSGGGLPKTAVPEAEIVENGLVGDKHNHPKIHGGPEKAVCLWSLEVIETLQQEGHNIAPGCAGENVTIAGLDWPEIIPGKRLQLGHEVLLEIASYTTPCRANMRWFADKRYSRIHQKHHPGSSRVYARVLQSGKIHEGDPVTLTPTA